MFLKQESLANATVSARQLLAVVWRPLTEERPVYLTWLKSTWLQFRRRQYRSIFIRSAVVASQMHEITRNFEIIRSYSSSRSSTVIDVGVNRKTIWDFLLVINSNSGRISYRFQDIEPW